MEAAAQPSQRRLLGSVKKTAIIVGTALVCLAALRNSLTWHLHHFWGASANFWEALWMQISHVFHGDYNAMMLVGTQACSALAFWGANAFFLFMDITSKPASLLKYKTQPSENVPVDRDKLARCIRLVLFNEFVVGTLVIAAMIPLYKWRGCSVLASDLPTFQWVLCELAVCVLVEEFGFYYSHRLMHHPAIYKHIHKRHHEWTAPIGITAIYAHPVEHVISNLLPPLLGPLLVGAHLGTAWLWFCIAILSTTVAHCGYHLPFFPSPEAHDFHHLKFVNNFGVLGVLDHLHGTDSLFRESKSSQRHFLSISLQPVRELIPDDDKAVPPCRKDN